MTYGKLSKLAVTGGHHADGAGMACVLLMVRTCYWPHLIGGLGGLIAKIVLSKPRGCLTTKILA